MRDMRHGTGIELTLHLHTLQHISIAQLLTIFKPQEASLVRPAFTTANFNTYLVSLRLF